VAVVLVYGVLFSVQNTAQVPLDLLFLQLPEMRLALWIVLAFMVGGLIGIAVSTVGLIRLKSDLVSMRRKLKRSEKELNTLRANTSSSKQTKP
jgi:putative membrane protein